MQLKQIDILNYKSITSPVSIKFKEGEVVTLIGKNGSGKTNILEALKRIFTNSPFTTIDRTARAKAYYYFQLTDEEREKYFQAIELDEADGLIKVEYNDNEPTIRLVSSPAVQINVKRFREQAATILHEYKIAANKYISNLKKIEVDNTSEFILYTQVDVQNDKGSLTHLDSWHIQEIHRQLNEQQKSIQNILNTFKDDYFKIENYNYSNFSGIFYPIKLHTIVEQEIKISPIIAKSLGITKKKLESANIRLNENIRNINHALQDSYNAILSQIKKFEQLKEEIKKVFYKADDDRYATQERKETSRNLFMQKLKNAVFSNCYYIDNENTLLFSSSPNKQYLTQQASIENFKSQNPLIEAFHNFLLTKKLYKDNESLLKFNELEPSRRKTLIQHINKDLATHIPEFDKNEIKEFLLKEENNQLALYIIENDNTKINVNETSLGRRWYLTYLLVKTIIKSGDILLIDEPAAFLHPQAQREIKTDLADLAKQGITVIYATHSPYMIPENWGDVYNVYNTNHGTKIHRFSSDDELVAAIKQELGVTRSADILFNLDKTLLLVEGLADEACIRKFAELLKYDLKDYEILPCNGSPILDVTHLCISKNIKFKALLDRDNLGKPERWLKGKFGYKEYLGTIKNNTDCVFTPLIRSGQSLEDCFNEEDGIKYFSDYTWHDYKNNTFHTTRKIDRERIATSNEFHSETLYNFEQLFNELKIPKLTKT